MLSNILISAILPGIALAASIAKRENDGDFTSDLTLRTVGARNTLVRPSTPIILRDVQH
jgi:hypothetical protein